MTSIEALNKMADDTPDSKNTNPGDTLYFSSCCTAGESLKKLKNHNFTFGYSFEIIINGQKYTRIVAYNQKNDVVLAWMGPDQNGEVKFPSRHPSYQSFLYLVRYQNGKQTDVKVSKERLTSKLCDGKKQVDSATPHIVHVNNPEWFGDCWPIPEHPEIENQKRQKMLESSETHHSDRTFYQGVATLCNIYKFNETYENLDPGLQEIYKALYENREAIFCREVKTRSIVNETVSEMLSMLGMEYQQLEEIFQDQDLTAPPLHNNEFAEADEKISFIKTWTGRVRQSFSEAIGGKQKTKVPSEPACQKSSI